MLTTRLTCSILFASLFSMAGTAVLAANADEEKSIYKQTNKEGVVEFTDMPNKSGTPVQIPPMNTFKQKPLPPRARKQATAETEKYTEFSIASPLNDKVVRENSGNITVMLNLHPALQAGHTAKVVIDNDEKLSQTNASVIFSFQNISRGSHKLQAFILDAQGSVLIDAPSIEFHLQRFVAPPKPATPAKSAP